MEKIIQDILSYFLSTGNVAIVLRPVTLAAIALMAVLAYLFCHSVLSVIVKAVTQRTKSDWDDDILNDNFLKAFSQLAPALVVAYLLPGTFDEKSNMYVWLTKLTSFYIVWAFVNLVNRLLQNMAERAERYQAL